MVLSYWAEVTKRPELRADTPEVAAGAYDRKLARHGKLAVQHGVRRPVARNARFVTRLEQIFELEELVRAGVPPILSVSFDLLNKAQVDNGGGHLVTCVGFDEQGNPVLNDPWAFGSKDGTVRRKVSHSALAKAWARSRNTLYLIFPENWPMPTNGQSHW